MAFPRETVPQGDAMPGAVIATQTFGDLLGSSLSNQRWEKGGGPALLEVSISATSRFSSPGKLLSENRIYHSQPL